MFTRSPRLRRSRVRVPMPMSTAGVSERQAADWARDMLDIAQRQDRAAFLRVYDHFMPRVCLYLRGLGAPDAIAEDLAQEAMLRLWQHAASYDPARSAVTTWLYRIARNLHLDRVRREPAQPFVPESAIDEELAPESAHAEDVADHALLQRRIDELSPVQARLVRMSFFEARSHQEIADELSLPLGTVKSHLRRAFLRLQGQLGGEP